MTSILCSSNDARRTRQDIYKTNGRSSLNFTEVKKKNHRYKAAHVYYIVKTYLYLNLAVRLLWRNYILWSLSETSQWNFTNFMAPNSSVFRFDVTWRRESTPGSTTPLPPPPNKYVLKKYTQERKIRRGDWTGPDRKFPFPFYSIYSQYWDNIYAF